MKKLLTLILILILAEVNAQNVFWAKNANGAKLDEGNGIAVDENGNTYITGHFESTTLSFGAVTCTNSTSSNYTDVFISKFDINGNCIWAKSAGGSSYEYGNAIAVDNNGNVFVTGRFESTTMNFDGTIITNSGSRDIFIAKYDSNGVIKWAKAIGGYYDEEGLGISCDGSGNVYVTGYFDSNSLNFDSQTLTNNGGTDIFVAKFNASGSNQWAIAIGGNDDERAKAIKTDNAGNTFITGFYKSPSIVFGVTTLTNSGSDACLFVAKINSNGNSMWATSASSINGGIMANGISIDNSGNSYVAGTFEGTATTIGTTTLTNINSPNDNTSIAKFDNSGNPQWANCAIPGPEGNEAYCIATDISGNSYISGWFTPPSVTFGSIVLNGVGYGDNIYLVKYNNAGQVQHAYRFAGSGASGGYGNGIACDNYGNAFLTGYFEGSNMIFGNITLNNTNYNTYDVYWTKIAPGASGIENFAQKDSTILYPNPCFDEVILETHFTECDRITVTIYTMQSVIIKTIDYKCEPIGQQQILIDLNGLASGLYYLKIETEKETIIKTLVLEK